MVAIRKENFNVRSYTNPNKALNELKNNIPDLILLDINMPMMNGFEFVEKLKESNVNIDLNKIVVCSSSDYQEDIDMMKNLGINKFTSKPIDINKVKKLLED